LPALLDQPTALSSFDDDSDSDDNKNMDLDPSTAVRYGVSSNANAKSSRAAPKTTASAKAYIRPWQKYGEPKDIPPNPSPSKLYDTNVMSLYGDYSTWPPSAGIRELVQNFFDGLQEKLKLRPYDILVDEHRNDRLVVPSDPRAEPEIDKIEFFFYRKAECVGKQRGARIGWISWRPDGAGGGRMELFNLADPLTIDHLVIGYSSKSTNRDLIGQHGEGFKIGMQSGR
jgi:hypothetical protein